MPALRYADSHAPGNKVLATALAGAIAWALLTWAGLEIGPEVEAALATIIAFTVGYIVPERASQYRR